MTWPQVALAAINVVQVVALAAIAAWLQSTRREVQRINGELTAAAERVELAAEVIESSSDAATPQRASQRL